MSKPSRCCPARTRFGGQSASPFAYSVTVANNLIPFGDNTNLLVNANGLRADESFVFNGSAEDDGGTFTLFGGFGPEDLTGGTGSDGFFFGEGRYDQARDKVDGLSGADDQLGLRGDYSGANAIQFAADAIANIDTIALISSTQVRFGTGGVLFSYDLTMHDGNLVGTDRMIISASSLVAGEMLTFNAAAEATGSYDVRGGRDADTITTGAGDDWLWGGLGGDQLNGGAGADVFHYRSVVESTFADRDTIFGFEAGDRIDLSAIAANGAFTFDASASGAAGTLSVADNGAGSYTIFAHTDDDGVADLVIGVVAAPNYTWSVADFIL